MNVDDYEATNFHNSSFYNALNSSLGSEAK